MVCLALPAMLTQYCLHKAQSEPEWGRCWLFWGILGSHILGETLKWEDGRKHGHYDQHLLLLAFLSFMATALSSQTIQAWTFKLTQWWCWGRHWEKPSDGSQQAPRLPGQVTFFWGPGPCWLVTCLFQLATATIWFYTWWQEVACHLRKVRRR